MLNTKSSKHLTRAVVHADGDDEVVLAHRCTKERRSRGIQPQPIRDAIKLRLCLTECGSRRGPCSTGSNVFDNLSTTVPLFMK